MTESLERSPPVHSEFAAMQYIARLRRDALSPSVQERHGLWWFPLLFSRSLKANGRIVIIASDFLLATHKGTKEMHFQL
jgi:hypothetical protein